jgi:hypothetical protein
MAMAFESAEPVVEPLAAYSQSRLNWTETQQQIAQRCDAVFRGGWPGRGFCNG